MTLPASALPLLISIAKDWSPYITALLTALVTWLLVGRAAKKLAAMQYTRSVFDAWLAIDTNLLGKPDLLVKYHKVAGHEAKEDPEKITVAFMILNPLRSIHIGIEKGYLKKRDYPALEDNLKRVLKDPVVFNLSQSELIEESFRRLCLRLAQDKPKARFHARSSLAAAKIAIMLFAGTTRHRIQRIKRLIRR